MKQQQGYPEVTVSAVIFNIQNEILLCKSHKWNDQYVIPGGHVEYGESMEDALRREIIEETGLEVYDINLLSLQESINSPHFHDQKHFIFVDYCCRTKQTDVQLNDEADSFVWVKPSSILTYDLGGYCRQFFSAYLNPKPAHKVNIFYQYADH